jgi:hypothetical protein
MRHARRRDSALLADHFHVGGDLHFVADDKPARLESLVPGQAEVAAIDFGGRAVADAFVAPGLLVSSS